MEIDKLKLLSGDPIEFYDVGYVHPFTIRDIKEMGGEKQFNLYLNILAMSKEIAKKTYGDISDVSQLSEFQATYLFSSLDESYRSALLEALSHIFKKNIIMTEYGFLVDNKLIDDSNFSDLTYIIKIQNCLEKPSKELDENPASDKARELLEKRRMAREKLKKAKSKDGESDGEPLALDDLVSILCANGNGINIFNVWDLSFYAFNDQFNRMKMLDDYQVNVQSLLAGANPDEIEFKHWMSKID